MATGNGPFFGHWIVTPNILPIGIPIVVGEHPMISHSVLSFDAEKKTYDPIKESDDNPQNDRVW